MKLGLLYKFAVLTFNKVKFPWYHVNIKNSFHCVFARASKFRWQGAKSFPVQQQFDCRKKCPGALVPWCPGALVPRCPGALVPRCPGALVHWCTGALVPWCPGALVPWCPGALVPWCPGALVPWCTGALVPWCPRRHDTNSVVNNDLPLWQQRGKIIWNKMIKEAVSFDTGPTYGLCLSLVHLT